MSRRAQQIWAILALLAMASLLVAWPIYNFFACNARMNAEPATTDTSELLEFMFRLGQAYLASGEQTALVELYLRRIASAYHPYSI
jgi:hypothetical protein